MARILDPLMDAVARVRASVHTKLLAGFLVGALLLLGMGILSMVVLNRMSGQVEELTALQERNDRSRQMIYLVTAQSHFRAMALLTSDDIWNNKVADAKTAFVAHIDASSADPRTGQQAEFAAITVINDHYAASGEGVRALYESGSFDGALGLHITEEHDISHELEDVLNEVINESTAEMIAARADFRSDRDGLRFAVVAFSGVSLLTTILLGVVLSGTFVRPLRASNATLALIGEGDFTQRLEVANRDEFGTLSENINRTSEDLSSLWGELNALNANLQQTVDEQVEELLAQREAIQRERSRIARELHDVVGSSLSMMVVQSQAAAAALDDDPSIARSALKAIAESGREALVEMRRLLGVLRHADDDVAETAPQPGLSALEGLLEQVREAGLPVELTVDGDVVPLPAGIDLSCYRIVQEALTNALRHAEAQLAQVRLTYLDEAIEIEVLDDGRGATAGGGLGQGQLGMRERVSLLARIHRTRDPIRLPGHANRCPSEAGMMVCEQPIDPEQGAPVRCDHRIASTGLKRPSTTTAWWPTRGCCCRPRSPSISVCSSSSTPTSTSGLPRVGRTSGTSC